MAMAILIFKIIFALVVIAILSWGFIEWQIRNGDEEDHYHD